MFVPHDSPPSHGGRKVATFPLKEVEFIRRNLATPEIKDNVGQVPNRKRTYSLDVANRLRRERSRALRPVFLRKGFSRHRWFQSTPLLQPVRMRAGARAASGRSRSLGSRKQGQAMSVREVRARQPGGRPQSLRNEPGNAADEDCVEQPADDDLQPEVIAQSSPTYQDS